MTQNKRIFINTIATYTRSMLGVLCGIFSARWVLEALGQEDFGLYTVVGGIAIFITFFNIQFAGAIARYYAFSIGRAKISLDESSSLYECRSWFTTAVVIHLVLPFLLVIIGCPLGECALSEGWISVPVERVYACRLVWRAVCMSSFFAMISVPFQAMYTAKQYIAELTIYSVIQTFGRTVFIYYMVVHPDDWLVSYAFAMAIFVIVPQLLISIRACIVFAECRIVPEALKEFWRVRQVAGYAIWTAVGGMGYVASHQCMSILFNNFFGAKVAGSFGVSQTVSGEAASLTGALQSAFQPAITTAYGAGDLDGMRRMAFRVCKIGTILTLLFAVPMGVEIDEILKLWLKNPPPNSSFMCLCMLAFIVLEKLTCGHLMAVNASGKIAKFQIVRGIIRMLVLPLAIIPAIAGLGPDITTVALPASILFVDIGDVLLASHSVGMSIPKWIRAVVCPVAFLSAIAICIGVISRNWFQASHLRIVLTTIMVFCATLPIAWFIVFSNVERRAIKEKVYFRMSRLIKIR